MFTGTESGIGMISSNSDHVCSLCINALGKGTSPYSSSYGIKSRADRVLLPSVTVTSEKDNSDITPLKK